MSNDDIKFEIFGTEELTSLFDELTLVNQNKIIKAGFRKSGKLIMDQAKANLQSGKKTTSKKRIEKRFRMEDMKYESFNNNIGIKIGNTSYLARWLESGTVNRRTRGIKSGFRKGQAVGGKVHSTGRVKALNFLENATKSKGQQAVDTLYTNIKTAFDNLLRKYSK